MKNAPKRRVHTNRSGKPITVTRAQHQASRHLSGQGVVDGSGVSAIDDAEDIDEIEKRLEMELRGLQLLMDQYSQADSAGNQILSKFAERNESKLESKLFVNETKMTITQQACKHDFAGVIMNKKPVRKSPLKSRNNVVACPKRAVSDGSRHRESVRSSDNSSRVTAPSSESRNSGGPDGILPVESSKPPPFFPAALPQLPAEILFRNKRSAAEECNTVSNAVIFPPITSSPRTCPPDSDVPQPRKPNKQRRKKETSRSESEAGIRHKNKYNSPDMHI